MSHYKENPIFRENDIHKTLIQQMMKQINPILTKKKNHFMKQKIYTNYSSLQYQSLLNNNNVITGS